ncbi:MAG: hypothetical protein WCL32_07410 [Planctomycetota bacterium]
MGFGNDIGIVAFHERGEPFGDFGVVALRKETSIPSRRVEDRPSVGVFEVKATAPGEAGELLPIASGFFGGGFNVGPSEVVAHGLLGTIK